MVQQDKDQSSFSRTEGQSPGIREQRGMGLERVKDMAGQATRLRRLVPGAAFYCHLVA